MLWLDTIKITNKTIQKSLEQSLERKIVKNGLKFESESESERGTQSEICKIKIRNSKFRGTKNR